MKEMIKTLKLIYDVICKVLIINLLYKKIICGTKIQQK